MKLLSTDKLKKFFLSAIVVLLSLGLAVGCSGLSNDQDPVDNADRQVHPEPDPGEEKITALVYFPDSQAMYLVPEEVEFLADGRPVAELLVEKLLAGPGEKDHGPVLPEGTRLLSLEIVDQVAYVNFSREVQTNHWGGSTGENMTIYGVVHTLTQLPQVEQVQFLIEGEKEESIWGHSYTLEPFGPNQEIIAPQFR